MTDTPGADSLGGHGDDFELLAAIMRRFAHYDRIVEAAWAADTRRDKDLAELRAAHEHLRAGLAELAHKLRIACDGVAEAAELAERLSRPRP